jgi:hypothetical protein
VTGLLRVAMRRFGLMRRVRMILWLEVLGLVRGTFAIPGHEFSQVESHFPFITLHSLPAACFDPPQAGVGLRVLSNTSVSSERTPAECLEMAPR